MTDPVTIGDGPPDEAAERHAAGRLRPSHGGNPAVDRIAELAARLVGAAASEVSLITDMRTIAGGTGPAADAAGTEKPLAHSLCTVTAAGNGPLVVHDAATDSRVSGLPPVVSGVVGSYLGVPLGGADGRTVGALCVFDHAPRKWSASDVALLEQLADIVVSELQLAALSADYEAERAVWLLAAEAAEVGTFDWDLVTGRLVWDDRLRGLFGYGREFDASIEAFYARVHPDDVHRVTADLQQAVGSCGVFDAEYRVVLPGGQLRWVGARGRALGDENATAVRLVGAAYDTTTRRGSEARVARVLESMSTAFFSVDSSWRFTYVNAQAEQLLGGSRDDLLGAVVWDRFPAAVGTDFETNYRHAMATGEPVTFDAYYPQPLDAWFEVRAWRNTDGLAVYFLDVTARRRLLEQTAEAARRSELLDRIAAELVDTHDPEEAADRLTRLVVPALADWCVVTLVDDAVQAGRRRGLRHTSAWHTDPVMRPLADTYARSRLAALTDDSVFVRAMETGQPQQLPTGATADAQAMMSPGPVRDMIAELAPESVVVHPLTGRERTIGVLTLCNGAARGAFTRPDLDAVRDVAGRAGLLLDNARLYRQQRDLAEGLQRSLFTALPEPDHSQVVARYAPAADAAQVGGDWYDAFLQPGGATVVVIGDVVGHDTQAAAAMSQVRTLVRGIGAVADDGPVEVLRKVDRVMQTLQMDTTATAVVARFEQSPGEARRGVTRMRWSNAGHPPPMVVNPDGSVLALSGVVPDLLLGVLPGTERRESEVVLDRGATVLLYTDGLVERREQPLDEGLVALHEALADLARQDLGLDALCDELLDRMLPRHPEDDVALVAVRLHPQDEPRPAEAGPRRIPPDVDDVPEIIPQAD